MCIYTRGCVPTEARYTLKLELQAVITCLPGVLGFALHSSARAACILATQTSPQALCCHHANFSLLDFPCFKSSIL